MRSGVAIGQNWWIRHRAPAISKSAVFRRSFDGMMMGAQRLPVAAIPEFTRVALVRNDVIHFQISHVQPLVFRPALDAEAIREGASMTEFTIG